MIQRFKEFLRKELPDHTVDSDKEEVFSFTHAGLSFMFISETERPHYFRILLPGIYTISPTEEDSEKNRLYNIIDQMNAKYIVAKSFVIDNDIWIAVEQLVFSYNNIDSLFELCIEILLAVYNEYKKELTKPTDTNE